MNIDIIVLTKTYICCLVSGVEGSPITTLKAGETFKVSWHLAYSHRVSFPIPYFIKLPYYPTVYLFQQQSL